MPLPSNLSTVTVTRTYLDGAGEPVPAVVEFVPSNQLVDVTATPPATIVTHPIRVKTVDGAISVVLPANDDPQISPQGFTWEVRERLPHVHQTFTISLPATPSTVDLASVAPVVPVAAVATVIPTTQKGAANGVATLDANGDLAASQVPDLSGTYAAASDVEGFEVSAAAFVALSGSPSVITSAKYPMWALDAAAVEIIGTSFRTPASWLTATLTLWFINVNSTTGVARLNPFLYLAGAGESVNGTQSPELPAIVDVTPPATGSELASVSLGTFTCQPAKWTALRLQRAGTSGSDTLANDLGIVGISVARAS